MAVGDLRRVDLGSGVVFFHDGEVKGIWICINPATKRRNMCRGCGQPRDSWDSKAG
jgi:hypothetical protein